MLLSSMVLICVALGADAAAPQTSTSPSMNGGIDLAAAVLVTPANMSPREEKAVKLLQEEVAKRTRITWPEVHAWPGDGKPVIAVGSRASLDAFAGPWAGVLSNASGADRPEGYCIRSFQESGQVAGAAVVGNDERGVLFGVGGLLRLLHMGKDSVRMDTGVDLVTAPACALRGHQLGYRPKTNSYDAWTPEMWEQYIRDLAVFGTNAIELIPPRSDDAPNSPHFPLAQIDMMKRMSQICDDYGLDVWVWYPAMDKDYGDPKTVEHALKEWGEVLDQLPRVDAVFVPGGDPGHTRPKHMLNLLEKQTANLHRTHPKAQMWMSPQGFNSQWMDEFLKQLTEEQPTWLSGIVYGPQNRIPLPELRKAVPAQYPIRHYPDITHTVQCQFPVPDWSYALAITEQREPINPRPRQYAHIFRMFNPYTIGFLTYSEGCNDDVNKIVWSSLGWEPGRDVLDILRDYARYFVSESCADSLARGILSLEEDWKGPLEANSGVATTFAQFREMERTASPQMKLNWRFEQLLYRAYYDAYIQRRFAYEKELEEEAMDPLRQAPRLGASLAMQEAERILDRAVLQPVAEDVRARVFSLGEALYQSIRMQLSVPRYQAIGEDRGANLDLVDLPLNDRLWLKQRFAEIREMDSEPAKLGGIDAIVNWTNPGPGGFYDDLGNLTRQPHLVRSSDYYPDPEFRSEPIMGFEYNPGFRAAWCYYAETRYESPLVLHYEGLDPAAAYGVRVVYSGDDFDQRMRLAADGTEIHPFLAKPFPPKPLEFDLPREVTSDGQLSLQWTQESTYGGNGRGCQVAEVWLVRKSAP